MRAFVVANFASGKRHCESIFPIVSRVLDEKGVEQTVFKTVDKETDIKTIRQNINSHDLVICMGGDGTVNEVLNALIAEDSHTPVGYIPCGSTNDFATNYNIPANPERAMEKILKMEPRMLDVGCLNGSYFCYVAAAGAFSEVSYETSRADKQRLGKAAYILEGAKSIPNIKSMHLKVEANGETLEGNYLISTFSNSSRIGGIFKFAKGMVDYTDGLMELALIEDPVNPVDFVVLLGDLIAGNYKNRFINVVHTDSVRIISDQPVAWSLDGEFGGEFCETKMFTTKNRFPLIS